MADYETGVNVILGGSIGPRIRVALEEYAQRKGMPLREYIRTHMGFMGALLALNKASWHGATSVDIGDWGFGIAPCAANDLERDRLMLSLPSSVRTTRGALSLNLESPRACHRSAGSVT